MPDTWVSDKQDPIFLLPFLTCRQAQSLLHVRQLAQWGLSIADEMKRREDWSKMKQGCMFSCTVCALNKGITIKGHSTLWIL